MEKRLKILQIALAIPVIILGLWLVNINFPKTGRIQLTQIPGQDTPAISRLGPEGRVKLEKDYQAVIDHPVYFDIRSLPWFNRARIKLTYQPNGRLLAGLAGQSGPGWQYSVSKPIAVKDAADGFKEAVFDFDLNQVWAQKNVRRFLLATQKEADNVQGELRIKSLQITLSR
jgi:hypothetical protein